MVEVYLVQEGSHKSSILMVLGNYHDAGSLNSVHEGQRWQELVS